MPAVRRAQAMVLLLLSTAQLLIALDFSIVNVALPSIGADLRVGDDVLQWVLTAFALAFGGLLMLGGRVADLYGPRRVFLVGLWVFAASCLTAGLADSAAMLLASRAVQGMAGAFVAPASLALLTAMFPEGPQRTRALGVYGAVLSSGFVAGMILGGVLTSLAGWRWVMLVNVPVAVAAALVAPLLLRERRPAEAVRRLDLPGALTVSLGISALVFAISSTESAGFLAPSTLGSLLGGVALLVAFVALERRVAAPLVPMDLLGRRSVLVPVLAGITSYAACGGAVFVLTGYMQDVLGYAPLPTGLAFCSLGLAGVLAGIVTKSIAARIGARAMLLGGPVVQAAGTIALIGLPLDGVPVRLLVASAIVGFGHVVTIVAFSTLATAGVPGWEQGVVGGLVSTALQVGAALGIALLGAVSLARTTALDPGPDPSGAALVGGTGSAFLAAVGLLAVGCVLAALVPRPRVDATVREPEPALGA